MLAVVAAVGGYRQYFVAARVGVDMDRMPDTWNTPPRLALAGHDLLGVSVARGRVVVRAAEIGNSLLQEPRSLFHHPQVAAARPPYAGGHRANRKSAVSGK